MMAFNFTILFSLWKINDLLMPMAWLNNFSDISNDIKRNLTPTSNDLSTSDGFSRGYYSHANFLGESEAIEGTTLEDKTKRGKMSKWW